jgi:hypothetical protein
MTPSRLAAALLAGCMGLTACAVEAAPASPTPSSTPVAGREHTAHTPPPDATPVPDRHSGELRLIANLAKEEHSFDFFNSDLAFWGDLAVQGSYDGFRIIDIATPIAPRLVADVDCRGPQGDVSIWEGLVFVSVDRPLTGPGCYGDDADRADAALLPASGGWEGIRVFDISRPAEPELVASVFTDCGSHTHTLVPDPGHARVLLYVNSYALRQEPAIAPDCINPHGHISVVEVPLNDPAAARVVSQPHLFDTPAWEVWPGAPAGLHDTVGCHDISVYLPLHLAAAACMSEGQIWDISDPERPVTLAHVDLPDVTFWHSAAWSNDGSVVAFGDENLSEEGCNDPPLGAIWFYRVADPAAPELAGHFSLERTQQQEICSAHMFNVVPGIEADLMVAGFYAGGTSVIDFSDPAAPREIAYYDVGGLDPGDQWAAYWYRGLVFASDHMRGLDIFALDLQAVAGATELPHLNPQTQE